MIVFGSTISPFVRKTVVFAAEKGVDITLHPVGFGSKDPAFIATSPFGKIPGFRDDDYTLCDSSAICGYIEAKHPEPALIPTEARARGRALWYDEFGDTILAGVGAKIFFNRFVAPYVLRRPGDEAVAARAEAEEMPPLFDYLEGMIPASGFLVEDRLTLADIAVASPFVNLALIGSPVDGARWPTLAGYVAGMLGRASFAGVIAADQALFATLTGGARAA